MLTGECPNSKNKRRNFKMSKTNDFPDCKPEICTSHSITIQQWCKEHPDAPVIVESAPGKWCYCYCSGKHETADIGIQESPAAPGPCEWVRCQFDPQLIKACQDVDPGTPVLLRKEGHLFCRCLCWDGELAPYEIKNGDGQYVPLNTLPAGGFVLACGMDLDWEKMIIRYATRPRQITPHKGIKISVNDTELIVPTSHMFLTYQKKLILAHQLNERFAMMGETGKPVGIDKIESVETNLIYQFISTAEEIPDKNLSYHLLATAGIITCDYAIQKAYENHELPASILAFPYEKQTK